MVAIPLKGGAYTAQSLTANAQRCINLFPEANPETSEPNQPVTHYPRPGLRVLSAPTTPASSPPPIPPSQSYLANDADNIVLASESGSVLTPP